jgi:hypothetical protein
MNDYDEQLIDDGGPQIVYVEEHNEGGAPQALWFLVSSIWRDGVLQDLPVIWFQYQSKYYESRQEREIPISIETWRELNAAVEARIFQRHSRVWNHEQLTLWEYDEEVMPSASEL